ncbi:MAG: NAD(P)/FAD-dependent oxidoreductase [Actinomycetota bacterium]
MIHYDARLPRAAEIVIVGGGVVGAATAFWAARAGLRPLLLERRAALCTLTTPVSTGAFRLQFDNREELDLVRESVELFLNFADITRQGAYDPDVRSQGYLWVTTDEVRAARQRALVARQRTWGQSDIELLDGAEVRERFPYVAHDVIQARWRAGDGFLDPKQLTMGLVAGSRARVMLGCEAVGFEIEGDRLTGVVTTLGTVSTETVVIAAGPFSGAVAALAGVGLPLSTVVRHKLVFPTLPAAPADAPMTIDDDTGAHWRPALRGAFALHIDPSTPPTPPVEDVAPDHRYAFALLHPSSPVALGRVSPFWNAVFHDNRVPWLIHSGQYTMTPDRRPLLGETAQAGLHVNAGYSGHGIMVAPAGSRRLIDVLTGKTAPDDHPFSPGRRFEDREHDVL